MVGNRQGEGDNGDVINDGGCENVLCAFEEEELQDLGDEQYASMDMEEDFSKEAS